MFGRRHISNLLLLIFFMASADCVTASGADFRRYTIQDRGLTIDVETLFLEVVLLDSAYVALPAGHGKLGKDPTGSDWVYLPDSSYFGSDVFEVSFEGLTGEALIASFEVWTVPRLMPVVGRWDHALHDSLGYYDTLQRQFVLCDGTSGSQGEFICSRVEVPDADQGWIPVAGNWGGDDGLARLGLFDPEAGSVHRLEFDGGRGTGPDKDPILAIEETIEFAAAGTWPVLGDWDGDGQDSIAFFDPAGSLLSWPGNDPYADPVMTEWGLGLPAEDIPWPVALRIGGRDAIGVLDETHRQVNWSTLTAPIIDDRVRLFSLHPNAIPMIGEWHPELGLTPVLEFRFRSDGPEVEAFVEQDRAAKPTAMPISFVTDPGGG